VSNSLKNMSPKSTNNIPLLWLSILETTHVVSGVKVFRKYGKPSIVPYQVSLAEHCTARDSLGTFGCDPKIPRTHHECYSFIVIVTIKINLPIVFTAHRRRYGSGSGHPCHTD
jgi:hypothetical protein